jgi:hypothetical protein
MVQRLSVVAFVLLVGSTSASAQSATAGRIKSATGAVHVLHAGSDVPAQAGHTVYQGDLIRTGRDGRIGLTLNDDTRLSLGPDSELRLDRLSYAPADGQFALAIKLIRGVAATLGRIASSPRTPSASKRRRPFSAFGARRWRFGQAVCETVREAAGGGRDRSDVRLRRKAEDRTALRRRRHRHRASA